MKERKKVTRPQKSKGPLTKNGRSASNQIDELGIQRGQNAEKGNTVRPENIRREIKEAAH